jgi:hypothetical protein
VAHIAPQMVPVPFVLQTAVPLLATAGHAVQVAPQCEASRKQAPVVPVRQVLASQAVSQAPAVLQTA